MILLIGDYYFFENKMFTVHSLGGAYQLMSIGDPGLMLSYCKEYWDGSTCSITPLSESVRQDVLSVYERWKLEDFDVVAFGYTPLPDLQLHNSIVETEANSPQLLNRNTPLNKAIANFFQPIFCVDSVGMKDVPTTATDRKVELSTSIDEGIPPLSTGSLTVTETPFHTDSEHRCK